MKNNYKLMMAGVGACAVVLTGCNQKPPVPGEQSAKDMMGETKELAEAMVSGKSMRCTMTDEDGSVMVYETKDKKFKVTADAMVGGTGQKGYTMNDLEYMYVWEDGASEGFKVEIVDEEESMSAEAEDYLNDVPNFEDEEELRMMEEEGYAIDCKGVSLGADVFEPPAGVNFVDWGMQMEQMGAQMEGAMEGVESGEMDAEMQQKLDEMMQKIE